MCDDESAFPGPLEVAGSILSAVASLVAGASRAAPVLAGAVAAVAAVSFAAGHLLLLAGAVALTGGGTLAVVLWLRRWMVVSGAVPGRVAREPAPVAATVIPALPPPPLAIEASRPVVIEVCVPAPRQAALIERLQA